MYRFRTWQPGDLSWLSQAAAVAAWESLSPEERTGAVPAQVAALAHNQVQQTLSGWWGTALLALAAGQPVGFVLGAVGPDTSTEEPHGLILTLWVAPGHRRRGLGRRLKAAIEQLMGQTGVRKIKICTGVHNEPAVALARSTGYKPEGLIGMKDL